MLELESPAPSQVIDPSAFFSCFFFNFIFVNADVLRAFTVPPNRVDFFRGGIASNGASSLDLSREWHRKKREKNPRHLLVSR